MIHDRRVSSLHGSLLVLLLGCGHGGNDKDMGKGADMAKAGPDLSPPLDMKQSPDLTPPTVTGLPSNCPQGVTAAQLYANLVSKSCALPMCHQGDQSIHFNLNSATDMKNMWVNKPSDQAGIPRITPGNIDQSYVMYKITGQAQKVTDSLSAGGQMPLGKPALTSDEMCQFVSWIKNNAQ